METFYNQTTNTICACDHFAPDIRVLRSVRFNRELAEFYYRGAVSASAVLDWVYLELLEHRGGTLFDLDDDPIDLDAMDAQGDTLLDRVWGVDPNRFINRYRERVRKPYCNRLKLSAVMPVLLLHFARQNWLCRTSGRCSFPASSAN